MTRLGKIARLPLAVRTELNRRLDEGEMGKDLVEWLNPLPEVQAVLTRHFGGRPITEQNLSEWKQGGYQDWQRREEAREWSRMLTEEGAAEGTEWSAEGLAEEIAKLSLVRVGQLLQNLPAELAGEEEQRRVLEIVRELTQLRRANASLQRAEAAADRIRLEEERWDFESKFKIEEEARAAQQREEGRRNAAIFRDLYTGKIGRPEPKPDAPQARWPSQPASNPTEGIRPNPTGSHRKKRCDSKEGRLPTNGTKKANERQEDL